MRDWKRRDGQKCKVGKRGTDKMRHQPAGLENARLETWDQNCRGGKHGKSVYGQSNVIVYVVQIYTRSGLYRLSAKKVMLLSSVN